MDQVITVTGPIDPSELGVTLAHEHLWFDISTHSGRADNLVQDVALVAGELTRYRESGGRSVVETTCIGIGRDPVQLRAISEASGVNIISGISFYQEETWPQWVRDANVDELADFFIRELDIGTGGVRAGLIAELTSHNEMEPRPERYRMRDCEVKMFQAAAIAQQRTGVAISTHASLGRAGHAQLDVLEAAGADLSRVVIGHCDAHYHDDPQLDLDYYLPILERGACCQFDLVGWDVFAPDDVRADRLATLIGMGWGNRMLLATDTCRRSQLHAGGGRGYDFLLRDFLPRLRESGITEKQIETMLVDTPREMFVRRNAAS